MNSGPGVTGETFGGEGRVTAVRVGEIGEEGVCELEEGKVRSEDRKENPDGNMEWA